MGIGGTELVANIMLIIIFGAARGLRAEGRACGIDYEYKQILKQSNQEVRARGYLPPLKFNTNDPSSEPVAGERRVPNET